MYSRTVSSKGEGLRERGTCVSSTFSSTSTFFDFGWILWTEFFGSIEYSVMLRRSMGGFRGLNSGDQWEGTTGTTRENYSYKTWMTHGHNNSTGGRPWLALASAAVRQRQWSRDRALLRSSWFFFSELCYLVSS